MCDSSVRPIRVNIDLNSYALYAIRDDGIAINDSN
jgi:hypothetical protein